MFISIVFLVTAVTLSLGSTQSHPRQNQAEVSQLQSTQTQHEQNQPENTCNTCCQGAGGMPGVPGTAGHNGLPGRDGRDGMKGEKGESGLSIKGDKGDTGHGAGLSGPQGLRGEKGDRGEQGLGLPGKTGPRGPVGPDGIQGVPGPAGITGQKGQKGECGQGRKSAFTAIKTALQTGSTNDVLKFEDTSENINGHFNLETDKFTCVYPGTYVFMYSIGVYEPTDTHIQLMKNGRVVVVAHTRTGGFNTDFDTTSSSAVLRLQRGDKVWLRFGSGNRRVYGGRYTTFSGFLLYEM